MTDNLEIHCAICWPVHKEYSEADILKHIHDKHPDYTADEAREYAAIWTEDAYEDAQDELWQKGQARRANKF